MTAKHIAGAAVNHHKTKREDTKKKIATATSTTTTQTQTRPEDRSGFSPEKARGTVLAIMDVMGKFRPSGGKGLAGKFEVKKATKEQVE